VAAAEKIQKLVTANKKERRIIKEDIDRCALSRTLEYCTLREMEDLNLQRLAEALPISVLHCRASSEIPKSLQVLEDSTRGPLSLLSYGKVLQVSSREAANRIVWAQSMAEILSPTDFLIVKTTLEGLK